MKRRYYGTGLKVRLFFASLSIFGLCYMFYWWVDTSIENHKDKIEIIEGHSYLKTSTNIIHLESCKHESHNKNEK